MSLSNWSDNIVLVELADEPAFSEDMDHLHARLGGVDAASSTTIVPQPGVSATPQGVILNFENVTYLNSSNLAQMLRLRKRAMLCNTRLRICCVNDSVWSVMMTTGLDTVFQFTENVATALASLQLEA